jgi:hypothetical protein
MTITRPLRLMTLHLSQIGFTDALTFISASFPLRLSTGSNFPLSLPLSYSRNRANNYYTTFTTIYQRFICLST